MPGPPSSVFPPDTMDGAAYASSNSPLEHFPSYLLQWTLSFLHHQVSPSVLDCSHQCTNMMEYKQSKTKCRNTNLPGPHISNPDTAHFSLPFMETFLERVTCSYWLYFLSFLYFLVRPKAAFHPCHSRERVVGPMVRCKLSSHSIRRRTLHC